MAWGGAVAEIDSRGAPEDTDCLAEWVRARADEMYGTQWDVREDSRRPRFFGGFSFDFRSGARGEAGFWDAFPAAKFVLPVYEVSASGSGAFLTVTSRRGEPGAEAELRSRAERMRDMIVCLDRQPGATNGIPGATAMEEVVSRKEWAGGVDAVLAAIRAGTVGKVVLARPLDVTLEEPPDSAAILSALLPVNPLAHIFLAQFARTNFLVGAAPELIGTLRCPDFRAMAVGGSTPRGADPVADRWLGRQLLNSRKDLGEHRIVVDGIIRDLEQAGFSPETDGEPHLLPLHRIQHLRTDILACVPPGTHILSLLTVVHPTAAVCGEPAADALRMIRDAETTDRGWYSGPVGWFDEKGNGEFAPALRAAVCRGTLMRLFAGAGLVEGSRAGAEWDETRVKLQTMLSALGLSRLP